MTKRHWWEADRSQLYQRVMALEAELSVAAALLELREEWRETEGHVRSPVVNELQAKWKTLLKAEPELEPEKDAA